MHLECLMPFFVKVLAVVAERPMNDAVIKGQEAQLTCRNGTEIDVFWFHTKSSSNDENLLYDTKNIRLNSFLNTNATGRKPGQILIINPVTLENSGTFKCVANRVELVAQLIVLESTPVCGTSLNASHLGFVDLWCRVNYTGFWPPHMQWTLDDSELKSRQQLSPTSISSSLTVKAESVGGLANYICKTYFVAEDNTLKDEEQTARNVPNLTFACQSDAAYKSATDDDHLIGESTTRPSPINNNGIMWILTSCAALACLVVFVVIVYYIRKHPDVCKKFAEPDLVQNAELIQMENRVDVHPHGLEHDFEAEEPEHMCGNNVDYAEVVCCERKLPSHMQDSPAWNNLHNGGACGKSIQNSPAWSHSSKGLAKSRCATPGNGSPMVSIEDVHYLDINTVATIPVPQAHAPRRPPARLPAFHAASYASIDHTSRPPPPLPPGDD